MTKMNILRIKSSKQKSGKQRGSVMLEALIAILIFSVGILGIVALQANLIQSSSESKNRADASFVVQRYMGQIWAGNPGGAIVSGDPIDVSAETGLPAATITMTSGCNANLNCWTATISWTQPGSPAPLSITRTAIISATTSSLH